MYCLKPVNTIPRHQAEGRNWQSAGRPTDAMSAGWRRQPHRRGL